MRRARFALGMSLSVLAAAYATWDQRVAWMSPLFIALPIVLLTIYGLAAVSGLDGPRVLRDASFGLALFGGADLLIGSGYSDDLLLSHVAARPLHLRAFNAIHGTSMVGTETNSGFLAPSDPTISALQNTRTAAFHASSLATGLVGAALCVALGRFAPLPRWGIATNVAAMVAAACGMAAAFAWPDWWASTLAFHAVFGLMIATALAARYGPSESRARPFGFALLGGVALVLGANRFVAQSFDPGWMADPVGMLVLRAGMRGIPVLTAGSAPHVVHGYLPSPDPRWARIRLGMLFTAVPIGLLGAGLASALARFAPRRRWAGTAVLMAVVAGSAVVMMAFRAPDTPWATAEAQMILLLGLLAAFRARFGPARGRSFFAGFAIFGLAHVAVVGSGLKWNSPLARPAARAADSAWQAIHGSPYSKLALINPETQEEATRRHARFSGTIQVATTTTSLGAALLGGCLCGLMVPNRRPPEAAPVA